MRTRRAEFCRRLGALLTLTAVTATGCSVSDNDDEKHHVVALFQDASPLIEGNDVEVAGVPVGTVKEMKVREGKAAVTLEMNRSALPIHTDATAKVRPATLLGERVVELVRGSPDAPVLTDGGTIPVEQTGRSTELDQILNTVDAPTGQGLAALVTVLGQGLRGNGAKANAAIKALAPAMTDTGKLVGILKQQNQLLNSVVDNVSPVARSLAVDRGKRLDRLVGSTHDLLGTTAANQRAFEVTVGELPPMLRQARRALGELTGTSQAVAPTLEAMRPATDNLSAIAGELQRFADSADPALANARPVLERGERLLDRAKPVAAGLKQTGGDLRGVAKGLVPIANDFTKHLPGFWNFVQGWALATNATDGVTHYYRGLVTINTDQIAHVLPGANGLLNGDPGSGNSDPDKPGVLRPGSNKPQPEGQTAAEPPAAGLLVPGRTSDGGVTGLNQQQERNALEFLLGGR